MANVKYRESTQSVDDEVTAGFNVDMWLAMGFPENELQSDALARTLCFISQARKDLKFTSFIAEVKGVPVGSACCQMFAGLYPLIFKAKRQYGYVWGVYVKPEHRRQGIARNLLQMCVKHLKDIQCTQITLHASPQGRPMYEGLGFAEGREMRLDVSPFFP